MAKFTVLPLQSLRWPSGMHRSAGLFDAPPQAVTTAIGLQFEDGVDDLDYYRAAAAILPSGRTVALWWHERTPSPRGLDLQIDEKDSPNEARAEAQETLGLGAFGLLWAPDIVCPGSEGLALRPGAESDTALIGRLELWYLAQCNGTWEHESGPTISTLDNPGWRLTVPLEGTTLAGLPFTPIDVQRGELDWYRCWRDEENFEGVGGPRYLETILRVFLDWTASQKAV